MNTITGSEAIGPSAPVESRNSSPGSVPVVCKISPPLALKHSTPVLPQNPQNTPETTPQSTHKWTPPKNVKKTTPDRSPNLTPIIRHVTPKTTPRIIGRRGSPPTPLNGKLLHIENLLSEQGIFRNDYLNIFVFGYLKEIGLL